MSQKKSELFERFLTLESDLDLFSVEINEINIWERIRYDLFREIEEQTGQGQSHTSRPVGLEGYRKGVSLWLKNLFVRNPYLAGQHDYMFVGHHRRKLDTDGYYCDIYCDPIHESCSLDYIHFERDHMRKHLSPARTDNLRYLDLITYGGLIQEKLGLHSVSLSNQERTHLEYIEREIETRFGVTIDLLNLVKGSLRTRRAEQWLYNYLIDCISPSIVVLVVSYGKNRNLIDVCNLIDTPVVELQHGVIYPMHPGYAFPGDRSKELFPDYLLVWGEYWRQAVDYPIPEHRIIPVGYPYLEQRQSHYADIASKEQIVFISQGTIGEKLSKFAIEAAEHPEISHDIVYKLHPGEYDRWREEYPWLVDADLEVIDSSEPPLYQLFAESSVQVGVYSTAVYEGLAFDLETYVYDCSGSKVLDPLIEEGSAVRISSAEELASSLGANDISFNSEYYFAPNATERMCKILNQLTDEGTPH